MLVTIADGYMLDRKGNRMSGSSLDWPAYLALLAICFGQDDKARHARRPRVQDSSSTLL